MAIYNGLRPNDELIRIQEIRRPFLLCHSRLLKKKTKKKQKENSEKVAFSFSSLFPNLRSIKSDNSNSIVNEKRNDWARV